ncbi:MAG: hypothetical protein JXR88_05555 [Clostridia bacterium]|nr:hypothetical protein [Clostridia bacterium]
MKLLLLCTIFYQLYRWLGSFEYDDYKRKILSRINSTDIEMNFFDRMFLKFEYTSGIHDRIPYMNLYNFMLISVLCFGLICFIFYQWMNLMDVALIFGTLGGFMPTLLLEFMTQNKDLKISKEMTHFISTMARWSFINDDIYYCFEKASWSVNDPVKTFIQRFLVQVQYSGHLDQAFDFLLVQSNNAMYQNFILNIKQADYSKGDLHQLLIKLEEEAYLLEGEQLRRASETFFDRLVIHFTMLLVILISILVLLLNDSMHNFYLNTILGNRMLSFFAVLFVAGFISTTRINEFNY